MLSQAEIKAIAFEVARYLGPMLVQPMAPVELRGPATPVEIEIAQVRQAGINPVAYLKEKARASQRRR
jgi:hypothetical protein